MSHFYGGVQGNRGQATRGGSKASGYEAFAQGWRGRISVSLRFNEETGKDEFTVWLDPGPDGGPKSKVVAKGVLG